MSLGSLPLDTLVWYQIKHWKFENQCLMFHLDSPNSPHTWGSGTIERAVFILLSHDSRSAVRETNLGILEYCLGWRDTPTGPRVREHTDLAKAKNQLKVIELEAERLKKFIADEEAKAPVTKN